MTIEYIVAASITAIGAIVSALIARSRKTSTASQAEPPTEAKAHISSARLAAESVRVFAQAEGASTMPRNMPLTLPQISDAIDAVPPMQADGVRNNFIGATVSWFGDLNSAKIDGDWVSVSMRNPWEPCGQIMCEAPLAQCRHLMLVQKGTPLKVTGRLTHIFSRYDARLEDCEIHLANEAEQSAAGNRAGLSVAS